MRKDGVWVVYAYDVGPYPIFMSDNEMVARRFEANLGYGSVTFWPNGTEWKDIYL